MQLTSDNVREIFNACLFDPFSPHNENDCRVFNVKGVQIKVNFDEKLLDIHKQSISEMLDQLPTEFKLSEGGGWSFLNACNDANGKQWADIHYSIDQLVCLGIGIEKVRFLLPRDLWGTLPGGAPYFSVL